jgi:hypothetical protein
MDNWYKKAQRSKMVDPDTGQIIFGPDMSDFGRTKIQKIKEWLQKKHPNVNWTVDAIIDFLGKHFIDIPKPLSEQGPKDKLHRPLDD